MGLTLVVFGRPASPYSRLRCLFIAFVYQPIRQHHKHQRGNGDDSDGPKYLRNGVIILDDTSGPGRPITGI
ncbi:hypothetical protein FRC12_018204 [Ceratobasidium sp. 428]|nr:hypothetical protein FRC12_018204 [Ceratobasidium sp. 428]